ncbi:MAG: N-acetylmuramoyl-L-alanine amidase, partial [Clostridia bacterium]|nr:N-acetylmuramoyl-L-alanine amidase [Clostridia bacterium]
MIKRFGKFVARRKYIFIAVFCCIVVGLVAIIPSISTSTRPKGEYTIVIDAGHGGRDGGSMGVNGSIEKELNLEYAKTLQKLLEKAGVNVVMTRTNDDGLYSEDADNKKLSDMRKRREIIN